MRRVVFVSLALAGAPVVAQNPPAPAPAKPATSTTAPAASQAKGYKIAWVNSQTILQQTPGYAAAESTFNQEVQGYRDEIQKLSQQLDSAVSAFDQQSIALSPAVKQQKQRDLQAQQQHLDQRRTELDQRAQQRQQELLQPIFDRIRAVLQGIRAEDNYAFILDAAPGGAVLASDPGLDITAKVVQRLQQSN